MNRVSKFILKNFYKGAMDANLDPYGYLPARPQIPAQMPQSQSVSQKLINSSIGGSGNYFLPDYMKPKTIYTPLGQGSSTPRTSIPIAPQISPADKALDEANRVGFTRFLTMSGLDPVQSAMIGTAPGTLESRFTGKLVSPQWRDMYSAYKQHVSDPLSYVKDRGLKIGVGTSMGLGALAAALAAGGGYYMYNKWKNRNQSPELDEDYGDDYEEDYYDEEE
jgi:hypothetical protein